MTVANQNLPTLYRGTDASFVFTAPSPPPGGIAGWTTLLTLKSQSGGVTTANGTVTDATAGVLTFPLARAATLGLPGGLYSFEVARTDAGANDELANGYITVSATVRDG